MGCVESVSANDKQESQKNRQISSTLRESFQKDRLVKKVLLLGAGESGKSTILKQMKVLYLESYSDDERRSFVHVVHANIIESLKALIVHAITREGARFPAELKTKCDQLLLHDITRALTPDVGEMIREVWLAPAIQTSFEARNTFQLMDNASYFLSDVVKFSTPGFLPTVQDILNTRVRTSGIIELTFAMDGIPFLMLDVGGQRNERRKWIHCFDNVNAVMFVVGASEYDQTLFEDSSTNRMHEAYNIFTEICNSRFFTHTDIILFLNKRDLFERKVQTTDLSICFPAYKGGRNYDHAIEFLKEHFRGCNKEPSRTIFTHVTCATDTDNIRFVFNAVKTSVFLKNMHNSGFI